MNKYEDLLKRHLDIKEVPSDESVIMLKKAKEILPKLKRVPGLRMIAVCNSVAMWTANKKSDIDLFIVANRHTMWFVRLIVTVYLMIIWERVSKKQHAWKFCLSFFANCETMDFKNILIDNDIYMRYWIKTLVPIVNKNNCYEKFININFKNFLYNKEALIEGKKDNIFNFSTTKINPIIWAPLNYIIYFFWAVLAKKRASFWYIVNKNIIKLHENDLRIKIRDQVVLEHKRKLA